MTLLFLARRCTAPVDTEEVVDSPVDSPIDTSVERPLLQSPAEATDLDPDEQVVHIELTAAPLGDGFAYNQQVPGPTIRVKRGDRLVVDFHNALDTASTIHWHGVHVPWEMDGVTWMGAPIEPGESFRYEYTLDQVGTYWYHPHFDTQRQVDLGLYGVLLVEDPEAPEMEELVVVFDSWGEHGDDEHHHPEGTELSWSANGLFDPLYRAEGPTRARLLNASNTGYIALIDPGRRIASDQGWVGAADRPDVLVLGPGDRVELEWTEDLELASLPWTLQGGQTLGDPIPLFGVEGAAGEELDWPFTGLEPTLDPGRTDIVYVLQGGPEGWLINGGRFPDVTIEELDFGEEAIIEVRNLSPSHHPFHLHGMDFEVLSLNGIPPEHRSLQDNIDVPLYSVLRIRLEADNPGDWMTHCHILPHAEGGMMTVLRVNEP